MRIPFIGGAYMGRSRELNSQACINWYPVIDDTGAKNVVALFPTPGLVEFYQTPYRQSAGSEPVDIYEILEVRGMHVVGDYLYAVVNDTLYKIDQWGTAVTIDGTLTTTTGPVWMCDNGDELLIVDPDTEGYLLDVTAADEITAIEDEDFPTPSFCVFIDGYFVVGKSETGQFNISALYDGTTWSALDYATAERYPDNLLSGIVHKGQLWLLGEESVEVWYNSGDPNFPFQNVGVTLTKGIKAANSIARDENSVFFLRSDDVVVRTIGYEMSIISTDAIAYEISRYNKKSAAIGYIYSQENHAFYVLTFPADRKTWVYDIATGFWHQRESYRDDRDGFWGRHRGNCYCKFNDYNLVGDFENGSIMYFDMDTYTDDGNAIRRRRAAQVVHNDRKNMFFHSLEIDFESGTGISTGQGSDPQAMLDFSKNGGNGFGHEHWTDIGVIGGYGARAKWNKLGSSRNMVFRVTVSDPIKAVIINAHLEATVGDN